jgi:transcription initiation factor IIE alpha subunit
MEKDFKCPYCGTDLHADHSEGEGYEEYTNHYQTCDNCNETFIFNTYATYTYEAFGADCLNDGNHKWEFSEGYPRCLSIMECSECGETRELDEGEKIKFNTGSIDDYLKSIGL